MAQIALPAAERPPNRPMRPFSSRLGARLLPYLLIAPPVVLVAGLIFWPALQSAVRTITAETGGLTLERYRYFFSDSITVSNLLFTFQVTLVSTVTLVLIGLGLSVYLRFRKNRIASWVQGLSLFPLFVPGIILAYALIQFLAPRGTIDNLIRAVGARPALDTAYRLFGLNGYRTPYLRPEGIVIGVIWEGLPFTVLILSAGLGQVDDALIESARDVGATAWGAFRQIVLPLLSRPLIIVFCLNFIGTFGSYTLPYLLGPAAPQMMGVLMQRTYTEFQAPREAETQSVITFLVCALIGLVYVIAISRQRSGQRTAEAGDS